MPFYKQHRATNNTIYQAIMNEMNEPIEVPRRIDTGAAAPPVAAPPDIMNQEPIEQVEEGCCCCLTDAADVEEWKVLECGLPTNKHRVCSECFTGLEANQKYRRQTTGRARRYERWEINMKATECPICRHLQEPSTLQMRRVITELDNRNTDLNHRLQNPRVRVEYRDRPQAAGGGGVYTNPALPFLNSNTQHYAALPQNIHTAHTTLVQTKLDRLKMSAHNGRIQDHFVAKRTLASRMLNEEKLRETRVEEMTGAIEPDRLRVLDESIEAIVESILEATQALERLPLDYHERLYFELFAPNCAVLVRQLAEHRVANIAHQQAAIARVQAEERVQLERRRALGVQRNANRRVRLIETMWERRAQLIGGNAAGGGGEPAWDRQRETCWTQMNNRNGCDTTQKTRRMCSRAGCKKKVCRRCDSCGDH